ncbi:MAG: hypothetical protein AB8I08_11985 [Sandaracinaceae bacterium]
MDRARDAPEERQAAGMVRPEFEAPVCVRFLAASACAPILRSRRPRLMSNSFPEALVAALEEAGAPDALALALQKRGLATVPDTPSERHAFLTEELLDALMGTIHPASAETLVESLLALASRVEDEEATSGENEVITVPPSASEELEGAYDDLVSGAVHLRKTPPWGLRRPDLAGDMWLLVSTDETLLDMARAAAPELTVVRLIGSEDELATALASEGVHTLVLDGDSPSVPIREVMEHLDSAELARGFVWRMNPEDWARWTRIAAFAAGWTPLAAELSVAEVVLALGR